MTQGGLDGPGDARSGPELDDSLLAEVRRGYNPPPEPPLEAMWGRIERDRLGVWGPDGYRRRTRGWTPVGWLIGMVAALVIGIGVGRLSAPARSAETLTMDNLISILKSEDVALRRVLNELAQCEDARGGEGRQKSADQKASSQ
jgi:hypothetical protein